MADARNAIEEIRHRIDILEIISEYVTVKRAGKSYKGLCPFHTEKTPSFTVSQEFQTWHCFGCGEHGDIFAFLMKAENLTFAEALERLAKRAGVELEPFQSRSSSRRELLSKVNALAATYYFEVLKRTPVALEYLRTRGLTDETIAKFRIGYSAPAWDGLVRYLTRKGISLADAAQAGLLIRKESDEGYYDRFRNRIIFPIFDIQERVIGFGGRALGDDQPKYLNSPETPLFSKARALYGLSFARKAIGEAGHVVVVEGYMDAITAQQAGFPNCVATLGTALTLEHIRVLSRYGHRVVLAYDSDSPGVAAALRGAAMFEESDCDVRIARLPAGDDPDSLLSKGRTAEFAAAVSDALPMVDYQLAILREQYDLARPEGRAAMLNKAVRVLADIPAAIERERHIKALVRYHPNFETGTTRAEDHIRRDVERLLRTRRAKVSDRGPVGGTPQPRNALEEAEACVLRALICGGEGAAEVAETLSPDDFSTETSLAAAELVFGALRGDGAIDLAEILGSASAEVSMFLSELATREEWPPIDEKCLEDYIAFIKKSKLKKRRTSDVLGPYIKQGLIDANGCPREQTIEQLTAFLRELGKLPDADGL